ncbi:hypothetical protein QQZ08_005047 [Neonectria magnoliae]|uniref:Uncharacterized protein n=1 Tax=Neonectria magnoliae TaxID=2732573 RepID=A0ABR1I4F3_9HYPO
MSTSATNEETAPSSAPQVQTQVNLAGKVIAVTGANRGIGLGVAECCLDNGAEVVYSIDLAEPGEEFAQAEKKYPGRIKAIRADSTREASITAAIEMIVEQSGAIHGMVVNAGRTNHKAALDFTEEEIHDLFAVNRVPSAPYGASKAGVRNMTHTLAMEWAKYGIRVNSVSPGLVETAMTYWVPQQPDWDQQLKYYGGMPRLAKVQELGGAYVYLLSEAASYTTSIDIPVNGVIGSGLGLDLSVDDSSLSFLAFAQSFDEPSGDDVHSGHDFLDSNDKGLFKELDLQLAKMAREMFLP